MSLLELPLADVEASEGLGAALALALGEAGAVIYLQGDLGAGKTTLVRALLRKLGHSGHVRSPTYTLVEPYEIGGRRVFHLDLYRLSGAEELEYLGLRDLEPGRDLILIEWPERVGEGLPEPDLWLRLAYQDLEGSGRRAAVEARTGRGHTILGGLVLPAHSI